MFERLEKLLNNTPVSPISWLIGLSGILMVRFFLEALSSPTSSGVVASDASTLVHYYLFFLTFALAFSLFLYFAIPKWKHLAVRLTLLAFVVILLAPVIDFLATSGHGKTMTYIFGSPRELLGSFLNFFGSSFSLGIRIEAGLTIAFVATIVWNVEKKVARSIGVAVLLYILIFIFVSLPSLIALGSGSPLQFLARSIAESATFANNIHGTLIYAYPARALEIGFNFLVGRIWFVIAAVLTVIWFAIAERNKTIAVFKNSRPERVAFHLEVVTIGMIIAYAIAPPEIFSWSDIFAVITLYFAFYFAWMFEVAVNDIADEEIDEVSNAERPLIKGKLSTEDLKQSAVLFLLASLLGGYLSGYYVFFALLAFIATYYIYSAPPTRYKRIPFFSSFLIALCCLAELTAGFFLVSSTKIMADLPTRAVFGIVILVFLWSHIRDLKDIEGDKKAGIPTVPVIFGKKGPLVVALLASITFLLAPIILKDYLLFIPGVPAAFATYYYSTRASYREKPLFLITFLFVLSTALLLLPLF
jgi:4-hydroxybenzoate polyprenyltransferase